MPPGLTAENTTSHILESDTEWLNDEKTTAVAAIMTTAAIATAVMVALELIVRNTNFKLRIPYD